MSLRFALFDFVNEKAIEVGEWSWIVDLETLNQEQLTKEQEVIVRWPTNPKVFKNLGRKTAAPVPTKTKRHVARILECSDNVAELRKAAKVWETTDATVSAPGGKRSRKPNSKYASDSEQEEEAEEVSRFTCDRMAPRKKSKLPSSDRDMLREIENKLRESKQESSRVVSDQDWSDLEDDIENMPTQCMSCERLRQENGELREKIQRLHQTLENQRDIKDLKSIVDQLKRTTVLQHSATEAAMENMSSSPTVKQSHPTIELWEDCHITVGQSRALASKKPVLTQFINSLFRIAYSSEELSNCSLTGKVSNAFVKSRLAKPKLPHVDEAISYIERETKEPLQKIKHSITALLNSESKRKSLS